MGYRLTKHQQNVWKILEPHLKNIDCKIDLTFDDEYSIYRITDDGEHNIIVPPSQEIIYHFVGNSGKVIVHHFTINEYNMNELVKLFLS